MIGEDLATAEVQTPFGALLVVAGPAGVERVCLPGSDRIAAVEAAARRTPVGEEDPERVVFEAGAQIESYFSGDLRSFTVPVELGSVSAFQQAVLRQAARIPFGETRSYSEMAAAAGSPGAVRAAGTAMGANPVPLVVPCHRVVRADGSFGLYGGGEPMKRWLLEFEGASEPAGP